MDGCFDLSSAWVRDFFRVDAKDVAPQGSPFRASTNQEFNCIVDWVYA